jgi:hypothetical protein
MTSLSKKFEDSVKAWFQTTSKFGHGDLRGCSTTSYVLHCPKLHVEPFNELLELIDQVSKKVFFHEVPLLLLSFDTQMTASERNIGTLG